jgi:hypothetical protein
MALPSVCPSSPHPFLFLLQGKTCHHTVKSQVIPHPLHTHTLPHTHILVTYQSCLVQFDSVKGIVALNVALVIIIGTPNAFSSFQALSSALSWEG